MPTGTFGGFPFDPEVYGSFVDQEATFTDNIIASGILARDPRMTAILDNGGTVGTTRFYNPLDPATDAPLVRNGSNDNTPTEIGGGKQSFIRIDRMKAWKANQLVRELTAADPMAAIARKTSLYWRMYWQDLLVSTTDAVLGLTKLSSHVITATNGVTGELLIDGQQAALGDFANRFGLYIIHSKVFAAYQKLGLVNYNKYTITNVLAREVELPTINGLIVVVNDRGTYNAKGADGNPEYKCYLLGQGCFLQATPSTSTSDYTDYNPELGGGTDILYNTRSVILHPNGVSFKADGIAGETPTDAEFTKSANWDLRFDPKNVRMAVIKVPAAQLA
nr:MAG TPA: major capsid protein [Caudoviricetes sp.]